MFVYLAGFAVSTGLFAVMPKIKSSQRKYIAFLALLIPCLIAGLRANTVGTDVQVYAEPLFEAAREARSFASFYKSRIYQPVIWIYTTASNFEPGYVLMVYLCAKVFRSMPVLLFLTQALTVVPIYKGLKAFENKQPVWFGMAVYYFVSYNQSLNMMRQWITMAFLLYGFQFLRDGKYKRYVAIMLVALLFHYSAVFGVVVLFVYHSVVTEDKTSAKWRTMVLATIGVAMLAGINMIAVILSRLGIKYAGYITGSFVLMPRQLLYRLPILMLFVFQWKKLKTDNQLAYFYLVMIIYDLLTSQLTSITENTGRISLFFSEYYMLAYPAACEASKRRNNKMIMKCAVLCYILIYWMYIYAIGGSSETVPYVSIINW